MSDFSPNGLDFFCIGVLLFTLVRGAFRGLVRELMGIAALVGAYVIASLVYNEVADTMSAFLPEPNARAGTAYALTFGVLVVVLALVGRLLDNLVRRMPNLGPANQAGGLLFGGLKGTLFVAVILLSLRWFPGAADTLDESVLRRFFEPLVNTLADQVDQVVEERLPAAVAPITDP